MDSNYTSPSTGEPCTVNQYLAEVVCTRKAKKEGNDLAFKFWNKKQKTNYQATIVAVGKLVKEFGEKEVASYFLKDGSHIYSVGWYTPHAWIKECLVQYSKKYRLQKETQAILLESSEKNTEVNTCEDTNILLPKPKKKKTLFEALNGKEERI
jgi:hypothetical protein